MPETSKKREQEGFVVVKVSCLSNSADLKSLCPVVCR